MKGYLMLSEGRSGSNWLGSLANETHRMGHLNEWLGEEYFDRGIKDYSVEDFFQFVISKGSTDNGRFAVKIFPRHLHYASIHLGFDFIQKCLAEHETKLIFLTREDTMAQAISFVRGAQTLQWVSRAEKQAEEHYDFDQICRAYFYISRSNQFWEAYLGIHQYDHDRYTYEDLLPDPSPYMERLMTALDVEGEKSWKSDLKIQRDEKSAEWRERFAREAQSRNIISFAGYMGAYGEFAVEKRRKSRAARALKSLKNRLR